MMTSMIVVDRGGSSNCGNGFGLLWVSNGKFVVVEGLCVCSGGLWGWFCSLFGGYYYC